jgi:predicted Zn-ribbon and HTH transcriptional regulator
MDVGIPEKDVYPHLEHIQQTFRHEKKRLDIIPSVCKGCGFVFRKRTRLTKPGKCPVCRGSAIEEPRYSLS